MNSNRIVDNASTYSVFVCIESIEVVNLTK